MISRIMIQSLATQSIFHQLEIYCVVIEPHSRGGLDGLLPLDVAQNGVTEVDFCASALCPAISPSIGQKEKSIVLL